MHGPPLQTIDYGNTQRCSTQIWRGKECFLSGNRKAAKSKQEKKNVPNPALADRHVREL
jgi:hypothetical protein